MLELPADDARANVAAMYRAMDHGRPIVNGYSGYVPPHYAILSLALRRGDSSPLGYLARGRPLIIIVNDQFDAGGEFKSMVEGLPSIERMGTTSAGTLFRLPAQPRDADTIAGATLPRTLRDAGGQRLEIDLGTMLVVRGIGFNLRWHYPELGERLLIERSDDGQVWQEAWRGWTGALAVRAAIEEPLTRAGARATARHPSTLSADLSCAEVAGKGDRGHWTVDPVGGRQSGVGSRSRQSCQQSGRVMVGSRGSTVVVGSRSHVGSRGSTVSSRSRQSCRQSQSHSAAASSGKREAGSGKREAGSGKREAGSGSGSGKLGAGSRQPYHY